MATTSHHEEGKMNSWFGGYRYAVHVKDTRRDYLQLFKSEQEALKEAKFMLHNADSVSVYLLVGDSPVGKPLYTSSIKRRLKRQRNRYESSRLFQRPLDGLSPLSAMR